MTAAVVILALAVIGLARRAVADAHRLRLVAEAEHELRGPLQTLALAAPAPCRPEIERLRMALSDLEAARRGRRAEPDTEPVRLDRLVWRAVTASDLVARRAGGGVHLDWSAGPVTIEANHGRLSQALGNLLANAVEHGGGQVRVTGRRTKRGIRVEVRDSGRGHGLSIAAKAVRDSGGRLTAAKAGPGTAVAIELPIRDTQAQPESAAPGRSARAAPGADADPPAAA